MNRMRCILGMALCLFFLVPGAPRAGETLDSVQLRGEVACGVTMGLPGFSMPDEKGEWHGLDVDFCRAVAAAVLGDASKVSFVPLTTEERFHALQTSEIDVLIRLTTCTFTRDTLPNQSCAGINFYDGQGFMVRKSLGVEHLEELDNVNICMQSGTTHEMFLKDYYEAHNMTYTPVVFSTSDQTATAFQAGKCEAMTNDQSSLMALRLGLEKPEEAMLLPEVISKEPLGPMVRNDDEQWYKIVKWTVNVLINAEELGVDSRNAATMRRSVNPDIQYLLGVKGNMGKNLSLSDDWAFQVIRQVGNYGEIFERNVGMNTPLKMKRGINDLWTRGGIMYAPPVR